MICSFLVPLWSISPILPPNPHIIRPPTSLLTPHHCFANPGPGCTQGWVCECVWEQLGRHLPGLRPASGLYSSLSSHSGSSFAPKILPALESTSRGNQLSPKLPQDGATNSRLGFCQLLQGEKTQNRTRCPRRQLGALAPKHLLFPRCDSAPGAIYALSCSVLPWFSPPPAVRLLPPAVSLLIFSILHLLCLSPASALLTWCSVSGLQQNRCCFTSHVHLKKKNLMCAYLLGCSWVLVEARNSWL